MNFRKLLTGLCALTFASAAGASAIFDLSGLPDGTTPTFSITSGGITATFTSPAGNGFEVLDTTTGLLTFSPGLVDLNYSTDSLTITFSQSVTNTVYIPFAIQDLFGSGPDSLTATANTGQTASFLATLDNLNFSEPEGLVAFQPTSAITSLTLSSPIAFAIGNAQIPEPMTGLLVGVGLAGLIATRRRSNPR